MLERARKLALWFDDRLHISNLFEHTAGHLIPRSSASWFYVLGSGTLLCFIVQIVTGICLALVYVPSGAEAYTTLQYMTFQQPLGWFIRALHNWGSNFMVAIMLLHMIQVFLFGAFKYPRELTWISGVFLMLCTLGMAFTGQVLRFDQDSYWGLGIGAAIVGRVPFLGPELVHMMLGGPIIAGETLSRFFTLHVFVLPGAILAILSMHLRLVLTKGISEYPKPGRPVRRETYDKEYEEIIKKEGIPFAPDGIGKDMVFSGMILLAMFLCALILGPKGPEGIPDPTLIDTLPRPDFFFLWIFSAAALLPDWTETFILLTVPAVGILVLLILPFISNTGERHVAKRPFAVLCVIVIFVSLGILTYLGAVSPWSPKMTAWSGDPTPPQFIKGLSPLELQGAMVMQVKQCRNCHAIDGIGGERGPDLADVATRLNKDQLIRQVVQGGGNMPAYGKNLTGAEVTALVAFMQTLHPEGDPQSRNPAEPANPADRTNMHPPD